MTYQELDKHFGHVFAVTKYFYDYPIKSVKDVAREFGWSYDNAYAAVALAVKKGSLRKHFMQGHKPSMYSSSTFFTSKFIIHISNNPGEEGLF